MLPFGRKLPAVLRPGASTAASERPRPAAPALLDRAGWTSVARTATGTTVTAAGSVAWEDRNVARASLGTERALAGATAPCPCCPLPPPVAFGASAQWPGRVPVTPCPALAAAPLGPGPEPWGTRWSSDRTRLGDGVLPVPGGRTGVVLPELRPAGGTRLRWALRAGGEPACLCCLLLAELGLPGTRIGMGRGCRLPSDDEESGFRRCWCCCCATWSSMGGVKGGDDGGGGGGGGCDVAASTSCC